MRRHSVKANYDRPTTVIGKDTILESGRLESKSSVQVNGKVVVDIYLEASLVVGQKGLVEGNVEAGYVLVAGKIVGNVKVHHQIHLSKTATVVGDIICQSIVIDEGAQIEGTVSMIQEEEVSSTETV